jgi:perosamine synthetase
MPSRPWARVTPWLVSVTVDHATRPMRDRALAELKQRGVDSRPFFELLQQMPPYSTCRSISATENATPEARRLADTGVNLPSATWLSHEDVSRVVTALRDATQARP